MQSRNIITSIACTLALFCCSLSGFAEVTEIFNSLLAARYTPTERVAVFKGRSNTIKVVGSWLDITDNIVAEGLSGQANFNISASQKTGGAAPFVEFILNTDKTGRFRVKLKRLGGEDQITIEFVDHLTLADVQVLTMSNAPAYLSAFPVNTDTKLRITGTNVDRLSFKPTNPNFYTASTQVIGNATAAQKDILIRFGTRRDKVEITQSDFVFTAAGKEFKYSAYKGNQPWPSSNLPFFRAYDKPDFIVGTTVTGIYNRKNGSCGAINNFNNFLIENPERCVTEFRIANPTATGPGSQVEKIVTMPDVKFTIINDSYAPQFTPITIHVKFGLNLLATLTIDRMIAKEQKVISFRRAESRKKLIRNINCADCFELNEVPFNWLDPAYTVIIDPDNSIPEVFDGNNTRTFEGSKTLP